MPLVRRLALAALLLVPGVSAAQSSHHLAARCGQSTASIEDTTSSTAESSVQVLCSQGVPGTEDGGREISAFANSASGVLSASGVTDDTLNGNRRRGQATIEQRMFPDPGGSSPIVVRLRMLLSSSGAELARNYAEIQLGDCITYVTMDFGGASPGTTTGEIDCDDTVAVDWTTSASAGALTIEAAYGLSPSALQIVAGVTGYLGNGTVDIPNGQFHVSGRLSVEQIGGADATFASESFLTVPEPGSAALGLAACAALGALARRR